MFQLSTIPTPKLSQQTIGFWWFSSSLLKSSRQRQRNCWSSSSKMGSAVQPAERCLQSLASESLLGGCKPSEQKKRAKLCQTFLSATPKSYSQSPASSFRHKHFDVSYKHTGLPSRTTCYLLKLYCCATLSAKTACLVPQYGSDRLALNGRMKKASPPTSSSSSKGMIVNNSCEFFGMRTQIHKEIQGYTV